MSFGVYVPEKTLYASVLFIILNSVPEELFDKILNERLIQWVVQNRNFEYHNIIIHCWAELPQPYYAHENI